MISSPPNPKPSDIRMTLFREARIRPQRWHRYGPEVPPRPAIVRFQDDTVYTDPTNWHHYDEPKEMGEDRKNNNPTREQKQDNVYYEPMENKETIV